VTAKPSPPTHLPATPPADGSVNIHISAPVVTVLVLGGLAFAVYALFTSSRVGGSVPWRRVGACAVSALALAAGIMWFTYQQWQAKIAASAARFPGGLRHEIGYAYGSLSFLIFVVLLYLAWTTARRRRYTAAAARPRRRPRCAPAPRRPAGPAPGPGGGYEPPSYSPVPLRPPGSDYGRGYPL
jgi:hypothetical protein